MDCAQILKDTSLDLHQDGLSDKLIWVINLVCIVMHTVHDLFNNTSLHNSRELVEGKIEILHCTTPKCHSAFGKTSLHDLRNGNNTEENNCGGRDLFIQHLLAKTSSNELLFT